MFEASVDLQKLFNEKAGGDAPACSEASFERRLRRERERLRPLSEYLAGGGDEARRYLLAREVADLASQAGLTVCQKRLVVMLFEGWTQREMAAEQGMSQAGVLRALRRALRKMAAARLAYRYTGLADVYSSETGARR